MKKIILFIQEDFLNIIYNTKTLNFKLNDIIKKGYIIDRVKFNEAFLKILKKEKIKSNLFHDRIIIVKNSYYENHYLFYLENIFSELGFLKIEFLDIKDLLPDENATFVEVNYSYLVINLERGIYLDLEIFNDIPKILYYFNNKIKDNIILFGVNKNIPSIDISNKKVYYYDNFEKYITESLLKVKKRD